MSDLKSAVLIDTLASDLKPVRWSYGRRQIFAGLGICAAASLAAVLLLWGVRPDVGTALRTLVFWGKELFVVALALAGILAMLRLARPGEKARGSTILAFGAVIVMIGLAVVQLGSSPPELWWRLVMGKTAAVCPGLIFLLALPILAGAIAVMRRMAPTRLTEAGAAAGLAAGGLSALVYSISCDESTMPFVVVWYGIAISASTLLGAALGRRALRW